MTESELTELTELRQWYARAIAFDGGHEVITEGHVYNPKCPRGFKYHYKIQFTGWDDRGRPRGWVITVGNRVLSLASGLFEVFEGRIEDLGAACLYADARQAQRALDDFRFKETARAMALRLPVWHRDPARRVPLGEKD